MHDNMFVLRLVMVGMLSILDMKSGKTCWFRIWHLLVLSCTMRCALGGTDAGSVVVNGHDGLTLLHENQNRETDRRVKRNSHVLTSPGLLIQDQLVKLSSQLSKQYFISWSMLARVGTQLYAVSRYARRQSPCREKQDGVRLSFVDRWRTPSVRSGG